MSFVIGQSLPRTVKAAITREQLRQYADSSGDINPIHLDDDYAKAAGLPSVIAHGMLTMAFLGDYLKEHFPQHHLQSFKVRFKKITVPGDMITCLGTIRSIEPNGQCLVAVQALNQRQEETTSGEARLIPPR